MLIPCCKTVLFLLSFFDLSSTTFEISLFLFLCAKVDFGCSWFVVQNWRIPLWNSDLLLRFEQLKNKSFFPCELNGFSAQFSLFTLILGYFAWWSLPSFHCALWSAFGLLRKFLHSLTLPHYTFRISLRSVQDTTPEGVLSSCGRPLTLTLNTSIGIWHGAGATKSWSSVLSMFCSWLISVNFLFVLSLGRCVANWSIPPPNGNLFGKLKWIIILSMKNDSI